ncbi:MAG: PAS domain-containing protein [Synergistaceae bacterium]
MHVNEQHEIHIASCKCKNDLFSPKAIIEIDQLGEDGWWDWHIQEDYEYMSPRFWECLGYEPSMENHPSAWQSLMFPEDLQKTTDNFNKHCATKGEHPFYQEVRYKHRDGHTVYIICRGKVIEWDENEKPVRMIGTHTDITNLKIEQQRYQKLFKEMVCGFALIEVLFNDKGEGEDYIILDINDTYTKITGMEREAVIGKTQKESIPDIEQYWIDSFSTVVKTREPIHIVNYSKYLQKWLKVFAYPSGEDKNKVAITFEDITSSKELKEKLEKQAAIFHQVFKLAPIPTFIMDYRGVYY